MYNAFMHRYLVVELKRGEFQPEYIGKLNFYCSAVDDILCREGDNPTIGLLLCQNKDQIMAEYALRDVLKPIGISDYELGKAFLADSNVSKTTFVAYSCAVRRLDNYIDRKPYRCHHGDYNEQIPLVFADTLTGYLQECIDNGNKPATICSKERTCISFLCFVENAGCSDLSQLNTGIVSKALLTLSNKDAYARIRQFLNYLVEKGITEMDFSRIVPHYKRGMVLPTTYTPDEILKCQIF